MRYTVDDFLEDVSGYGDLVVAYRDRVAIKGGGSSIPLLSISDREIAAFLQRLYALVKVKADTRIYRGLDDRIRDDDYEMLPGRWWSPRRPSAEIDDLGLESLHLRSRHELAVKPSWNDMNFVFEAVVRPGTLMVIGRAAPQTENGRRFGGGAVQFLVPPQSGGGLVLTHRHQAR